MMKRCYVLDGEIINVGDWDYKRYVDEEGNEIIGNQLPEGATIEERDFEYDEDRGWYEVGTPRELTEIDKLKISQAEQFETILELLGGM